MEILLLAHLAATLVMVGIIWFVQVVHYPLFAGVGREGFATYAAQHSRWTTWVVAPPMLVEAATGLGLLVRAPAGIPRTALWLGLALLLVIWLSTALLQVPRHTTLGRGWDAAAHRVLVAGNWLRTAAWTLRGVLVLWMAAMVMGSS